MLDKKNTNYYCADVIFFCFFYVIDLVFCDNVTHVTQKEKNYVKVGVLNYFGSSRECGCYDEYYCFYCYSLCSIENNKQ